MVTAEAEIAEVLTPTDGGRKYRVGVLGATGTVGQRYCCSRCGGLLEVEQRFAFAEPQLLPALWEDRRKSLDARVRSGVWRFRELLPFPENSSGF